MESCIYDHGGVLAPVADSALIQAALCGEVPTQFRIQGIAREECWVDHQDGDIDPTLLSSQTNEGPYASLYVNTESNTIGEEGDDVAMAVFCQFPKGTGEIKEIGTEITTSTSRDNV